MKDVSSSMLYGPPWVGTVGLFLPFVRRFGFSGPQIHHSSQPARPRPRGRGLHGMRQPGGRGQSERGSDGYASCWIPHHVPAVTFNRLCASGLTAVNQAARAIRLGDGEVYIAGGVESMSRAPLSLPSPPQHGRVAT